MLTSTSSGLKQWYQWLLLSVAVCFSAPVWSNEDFRVLNGLKMFKSILQADQDINDKHNPDNGLDIVFLYTGELQQAEKLARSFLRMGRGDKKGRIKDMPVFVHLVRDMAHIEEMNIAVAGIFILNKLNTEEIKGIAQFGLSHNIVTYSPFQGDVEKGIFSGLTIDTSPKPFINAQVMNNSGIRIKSFFLRVATLYEPTR
ncbi:hypothetical protein [Planctobacterium marinum]|uniref:hypothetical protein n=1 Tax=Planctobacterium marinum TaxID=1631968 RepID=UPI001E4417B0|nr:hypothetical protein [Planctobacterium marinum]MCC2604474.1 hypothetical protein [Planctobacterium marinum]